MSGLIQSGLVGVGVHALHLKVVALVVAAWVIASLPVGLLLGRAWQLFGYRDECAPEIPRTPFEADAGLSMRPVIRRDAAHGF